MERQILEILEILEYSEFTYMKNSKKRCRLFSLFL